jgi:hypothetical protein
MVTEHSTATAGSFKKASTEYSLGISISKLADFKAQNDLEKTFKELLASCVVDNKSLFTLL